MKFSAFAATLAAAAMLTASSATAGTVTMFAIWEEAEGIIGPDFTASDLSAGGPRATGTLVADETLFTGPFVDGSGIPPEIISFEFILENAGIWSGTYDLDDMYDFVLEWNRPIDTTGNLLNDRDNFFDFNFFTINEDVGSPTGVWINTVEFGFGFGGDPLVVGSDNGVSPDSGTLELTYFSSTRPSEVPVPPAAALLLLGIGGIAALRRRRG